MVAFKKTFVKVLRIQETFSVARRRMSYHLTRLSVRGTAVLPTKSVLGLGTEGNLIKNLLPLQVTSLPVPVPPSGILSSVFRVPFFPLGAAAKGREEEQDPPPPLPVMEKFLFVSNFANSPHFSAGRVRKKKEEGQGNAKGMKKTEQFRKVSGEISHPSPVPHSQRTG